MAENDVVAIRVLDTEWGECGFLTWAGVYDTASPELLEAICPHFKKFGLRNVLLAEVCPVDLLSDKHSFNDGLRHFAPRPIPGNELDAWRQEKRRALAIGAEMVFLAGNAPRKR